MLHLSLLQPLTMHFHLGNLSIESLQLQLEPLCLRGVCQLHIFLIYNPFKMSLK